MPFPNIHVSHFPPSATLCNSFRFPQFPPPLHFGIFWCRCFLFRCFMSRICSVPNQQSTLRTAHVRAYHCVQLSYKIQHRTSDNLRTYHLDSHHCADVVCWRGGRKSISIINNIVRYITNTEQSQTSHLLNTTRM